MRSVIDEKRPAAEEDVVVVVPHDSRWASLYVREAPRIQTALCSLVAGCEHIGSTAVPGLWAKPVVDVLIGSNRGEPPTRQQLTAMGDLGYLYLGEDERRPGRFFFRRRKRRFFNVSVVPYGGQLWMDNLRLRDYLRRSPEAALRYSVAKKQSAAASPGSLLGYQNAKRAVLEQLKLEARQAEEEKHC